MLSSHLIMAPKNMMYISPEYISKYKNNTTEFVKKPLHSTMKGNRFTFSSDETKDITSFEQLTLYATFKTNREVVEKKI